MESKVPVRFTLVGKPKMAPQPPAPILGLSTERFVFQDLQPIAISAFAPLIQAYRAGLQKFIADVGRPPTEEEGLAALRTAPAGVDTWKGPYLSADIPETDPWNRPLRYSVIQTANSRLFNLYSVGENGIDEQGLGDDLR
ncbi:MAG: type II secretion system protein GspG [Candidatus Omnitrophica bacterium]|nr:type II secretion system protein GspG [Candidatus Omnitrophota bacterium]